MIFRCKAPVILFIILFISCKKESGSTPGPGKINVTLSDFSYRAYEIGVLEADAGQVFEDVSLDIEGVSVPVQKSDAQTVVFVVPETVGTGSKKLKLHANGTDFTWDITVHQGAPATATIEQLTADYQEELDNHRKRTQALIDSVANRLDSSVNRVPTANINILNDSINVVALQLSQLSPEAKKAALNIIYAELEDLKEIRLLSEDLLMRQLDGLRALKNNTCASEWEAECILEDAKTIISALTVKLRKNARKGALLGIATGLVVSAFGGEAIAIQAGSATAFLYLGLFTARDVYNTWDELQFSTFNFLVSKFGSEEGSGKKEIELINDVSKDFTYKVKAKNLSPDDKKFEVSWVTGFINVFERFRGYWFQYMPDWVQYMPDYAPQLRRSQYVKKLDYLEITDISNPNISFVSLTGSPQQPSLKFTTQSTQDEFFTFRFTYDDGAYKVVSQPVECVLKPFVDSMALYNNMMPGFWTRYLYQYESGSSGPVYLHSTEKYQFFADGAARLLRYTSIWSLPSGHTSNTDIDYSSRSDWESDPLLKSDWYITKETVAPYGERYLIRQEGMVGRLDFNTRAADGRWGAENGYIWQKD
ncbi:MAG TPA: hypothetical protein VEC12_15130 [Bacteroidia bacterium]|nr:hypothetical protein [Bacteroidia bacterium]